MDEQFDDTQMSKLQSEELGVEVACAKDEGVVTITGAPSE